MPFWFLFCIPTDESVGFWPLILLRRLFLLRTSVGHNDDDDVDDDVDVDVDEKNTTSPLQGTPPNLGGEINLPDGDR